MANLRRLGVYGKNLPTKRSKSLTASDMLIGGIIGKFQRRYDKAFVVRSIDEASTIFGGYSDSSTYGWDAVNAFFANAQGVDAKLYISPHVGYTGSAIDSIAAFVEQSDSNSPAQKIIRLTAAYKGNLQYGTDGNNTGFDLTLGTRFATTCSVTGTSSDTFATVTSVAGIRVGDIVKMVLTGGGGATVYKKITSIDDNTGKISFVGAIHVSANLASTDVVSVPGFKIQIYRKDSRGNFAKVEPKLAALWMTTEPEVSEFYAPNVYNDSSYIKLTMLATTSPIDQRFPIASSAFYITGGTAGTIPTTAAHWSKALSNLDFLPIRVIANPETTDVTIQKAIETYCKNRDDSPKVLYNIPSDQSKAQLIVIGNNYQRSDDVLGVIVANWLGVSDPYNQSEGAPYRSVPNVGHTMGLWMKCIGTKGIHYSPAQKDLPISGAVAIIGSQFTNDYDRTDIANAGINMIHELTGYGFVIRNFFTPSTSTDYQHVIGIMMRDFIKISAVDSLQTSENMPNSIGRIKEDAMAILTFLYRLWDVGSTGNVPTGETFGQGFDASGNETKPTDHFTVQADEVNNPVSSIQAGNRNVSIYFTYPAPAGSIEIGCGILLRS